MKTNRALKSKDENLIENDLKKFIREVVNSSLKAEILQFIYYNPYSVFTTSSLANSIKRKEQSIKKVLADLFKKKIVKKIKGAPLTLYIFAPDKNFISLLDRFMKTFSGHVGREEVAAIINEN